MDSSWHIAPNGDIIEVGSVELEYLLFTLRLDGDDHNIEVTVPIANGMDYAKVRRGIEAGPMIGIRLAERCGADRIAGRTWTVTGCRTIDAATHRARYPDDTAWDGDLKLLGDRAIDRT